MPNIYADLHMHTTHSDGKLSPSDLVNKLNENQVSVISITDHDTISAYNYVDTSKLNSYIKLISGTELTVYFNKKEIHMLAYGFDLNNAELISYLNSIREQREERAEKIIRQLHTKDVQITYDELKKKNPKAILTRSHIAELLYQKGIVSSPWHAFKGLIDDNSLNVPKVEFKNFDQAIKIIKTAGGFCSLAHPMNNFSQIQLYYLVKFGLRAIEISHPSNSQVNQKRLQGFAKQYSLNTTGGSDYHGRTDREEKNIARFGLDEASFDKLKRQTKIEFLN